MAAITETVEIARRPEDVFAYIDDLERHGEWQEEIVSAHVEGEGPTKVGTRAIEKRRMGRREQEVTYEITEHDPPRTFAFRGTGGPIRPIGKGTVEPLDGGERSRVTIDFDFEAHGIAGKILKPMALMQARKSIPKGQQRLKERLESGAA
ncbi:MAG TPA: SRPBCC family protein [Gaiellaceae bacterium]